MRILAAAAVALLLGSSVQAQAQTPTPPKLVIVISVDQFGASLFDEYRPQFTAGLKRLSSGTVFHNGYQGQAATETCPGHSTILTGDLPARTGIIANSWYDWSAAREDKRIYCAEDERVPGSTHSDYKVSAVHLKVPTLGDLLKKISPGSRNVAVSGKDRAAVMMSGHDADQRWYWGGRQFVTDLASPVPASIPVINAAVAKAIAAGSAPLVPPPFCQSKARPITLSNGQTVGTGTLARRAGDYEGFRASPDLDGATLAVAAGLIQDMKLGRGQSPDILSIGLSATDYIGHAYGSEGQEMCLNIYSLDRELGDFLSELDKMHLDYAVVLTADHGVEDLAERVGAPRADPALSASAVGTEIAHKLGIDGQVLFGGTGGDIYLDPKLTSAQRIAVEAEALRIFRAHPQVEAVFTRAELERTPVPTGSPDKWSLLQRARASFDPQRSGDLVVLLKKGVSLVAKPHEGDVATHGSPWDYDRRVPILFWRKRHGDCDPRRRNRHVGHHADHCGHDCGSGRAGNCRRPLPRGNPGNCLSCELAHSKACVFSPPEVDCRDRQERARGRWAMKSQNPGLTAVAVPHWRSPGCVQTRQYADLQFTPPQGDYKLLVLRPDVSVGSVTTGGMTEPRADWTGQARANIVAALKAQQAERGGKVLVSERRSDVPGVHSATVADLERLNSVVDESIVLHKYLGATLPTKRRKGLDYTLGQDAVDFGRKTGFDYMLFLHAEDARASSGRTALQLVGIAGCVIGFCAPSAGQNQLAYASLVDLRTGDVVWFNVLLTGSDLPGVTFGDIRTPEGAAQMVDRLLGRMKPGRAVREATKAKGQR